MGLVWDFPLEMKEKEHNVMVCVCGYDGERMNFGDKVVPTSECFLGIKWAEALFFP